MVVPAYKPQEELCQGYKDAQPKKDSSLIQQILYYDICGWKVGAIAEKLNIGSSKVSTITNSPLFKHLRAEKRRELVTMLLDKKTDLIIAGDPVLQKIKALATKAVDKKEYLLDQAESEFVQNSVASDILDRAGYRPESKKVTTKIEVTEKMAERFERVLDDGTNTGHVAQSTISIEEEVSE